MLLGAALAAYPLAGAGRAAPAAWPLAGLSLALLALSLRQIRLLGLVLIALTAELAVRELVAHVPAGVVVAYGAGLLLLCELVAWAESLRSRALVDPAVVVRRIAQLSVVAMLAAGASGLTLAAGGITSPDAFAAGLAGAAAVAALLALVWWLGREAP
jgi:hypothetical protein